MTTLTVVDRQDEVERAWKEYKSEKRVTLRTFMNRYGTDKLFTHHYDEEYTRHFEPLRDRNLIFLEIGVGGYGSPKRGGESLRAWRDYFPNASIHGLDNEPKTLSLGARIQVWHGSQNDSEFLTKLSQDVGPFDIVVDDGSHRPDDQKASLFTLFPLLNAGGIYVIEDLETSYRPDYGGNPNAPATIGVIQRIIDGLHWQFWKGKGPTPIDQLVKSVHVSKELVFIYKH